MNIRKKFVRLANLIKRMTGQEVYSYRAYIRFLDTLPIDEQLVLLESHHGTTLGGNIAALLETLCAEPDYDNCRIYVAVQKNNKEKLAAQWAGYRNSSRVRPVIVGSVEYFRILASAGFLFNDNTFCPIFTKREGQIYLNTWHGTPLKTLGRDIKGEAYSIGNTQRNFFSADLMLYPNEHTKNVIQDSYMLNNFGTGRMAMTGYPRNEVFFKENVRRDIRERYKMGDKTVYAYLPTWRGIVGKVSKEAQRGDLKTICDELDRLLPDNVLVYLKLHPMMRGNMNLKGYKHIADFPEDVPAYDFLQGTDGLLTDYSSIMFDYAVTGRKIVLYTYDEEEYVRDRGLTFGMDELPFPRVSEISEVARELTSPKNYDDSEFLARFCPYEKEGVTRELLHNMFTHNLGVYPKMPDNGKKNVVVYGGDFIKNGIATALVNLLNRLDTDKYNYLVLYRPSPKMTGDKTYHEPDLDNVPRSMAMLGMASPKCGTFGELVRVRIWRKLQRKFKNIPFKWVKKDYESIARRDANKTFGPMRVDALVQYNGYFADVIEMFKVMKQKSVIYVHNDMNGEDKKSFAIPHKLLADAYANYDEVALVTKELTPRMNYYLTSVGQKEREFAVSLNTINFEDILAKGELPIEYNYETVSDTSLDELNALLDSDDKVIVNVGRFSPEKGQLRLIEAFEKAVTAADKKNEPTYRNAHLVILGSYGPDYDRICARAKSSPVSDRITVIKFLKNPYALVKRCDFFVLSSLYEGFGLVLCEADILGVPCFSTRITGPTDFMEKYGGMLVDDSTEAIAEGIKKCLDGEVKKTLTCDYAQYNREAVEQFEDIVGRLLA